VSAPQVGAPPARGEELLRGLLPPAAPASAADVVAGLELWERPLRNQPPARPQVLLNMVSSADGRATFEGRSGGLSSPADRALFHALRMPADGVLIGAGTVRAERYGRLIHDPAVRELRAGRGLTPEPLACIVTASGSLDPDLPLLAEPQSRVVVVTPSADELPDCAAQVEYVRCSADGVLDLGRALGQLHERFGVQLLLCEGGPHLGRELLAAGLLDQLFLSIAPMLVGGASGASRELRIVAGAELDPPVALELLGALESASHLFLRYGVVAPERVSRETIESSSLAR
jgi:riboflavin biosynthesis pyrimidine reductase